jgi:hypothetical protein
MSEIALSNAMRVQISAAAATLHPSVRQSFVNAVMRSLSYVSRPPSTNDVLMVIKTALASIPASAVIISRSVGASTNDEDDRRRRIY